ncbi:MAG: glycosyltransferase [Roseburia sp.]|nr:glycosyltransferase [Roseburia sp.]
MKILFHLNSMGRGGAERVVSILSRAFAGDGHEVVLATEWLSENEYETDARVRRISVGLTDKEERRGRLRKAALRLARLRSCIRKEKPDIVVSFCSKANFRSAIAMLGMRTPLLVSVRNDPDRDYAPYKIPTRLMEKRASGCVFQTPDAMKCFSKELQKKSRVIFNPLSENYLEPEVGENGPTVRKKEIVTVGRISGQKNQLLLLRAFRGVLNTYPDYWVKIYGEIQDREIYDALRQYIIENGLEDKVRFMGVTDSLREEIRDAALFVLPSDYEGMPNALIEAMVLGLPCIATDCPCGGAAMLVQNGVSGLLVPTGRADALQNAMEELLANPQGAQRMGENAKRVLEKVHPDKVCGEWIRYISELLGN